MEYLNFICGGSRYMALLHDAAATKVLFDDEYSTSPPGNASRRPVTLLNPGKTTTLNREWLAGELERMSKLDDVWNHGYAGYILLNARLTGSIYEKMSVLEGLERASSSRSLCSIEVEVPAGPYYLLGGRLYPVYRLYDDSYGAFVSGVLQDPVNPSNFHEFPSAQIPVPSRAYFPPASPERPLSGIRIAIKDIFDLKGTITGVSCKDYRQFIGPAASTAEMIRRVLERGAVVVGKTKTTQFASGELATDWVDYQCPFNPRGDGYLDPDCSSTGSAVAIAAYDWLDVSIGSDISPDQLVVRESLVSDPLTAYRIFVGCFQSQSRRLDTVGHFCRSSAMFGTFGAALYLEEKESTEPRAPRKILYASNEFNKYPDQHRQVMDEFVRDLEISLGVRSQIFDVFTVWSATMDIDTPSIEECLETTLAHLHLYDSFHNNLKFRDEFKARYQREPYVNPLVRFKWDLGSKLTEGDYKLAREERNLYRTFLRRAVFNEGTILVLPAGGPDVRYRDSSNMSYAEKARALQRFGFCRDLYSFLGGLPQVNIPIGQFECKSAVTGAQMLVPVSVSLVGAPGTDIALMELAHRTLQNTGRPIAVLAGATAFDV